MKLYTNHTYNRLTLYALAIGLVFSIAVPFYMGKDLIHALISNIFLCIVIGLGIYSTYKQTRIPIFEINESDLIVNDIRYERKVIPLNSITGIRKYMIFGFKLVTLYGEISIPLRSLHQKDRQILLSTLKLEI
jgi:hypothetical protein